MKSLLFRRRNHVILLGCWFTHSKNPEKPYPVGKSTGCNSSADNGITWNLQDFTALSNSGFNHPVQIFLGQGESFLPFHTVWAARTRHFLLRLIAFKEVKKGQETSLKTDFPKVMVSSYFLVWVRIWELDHPLLAYMVISHGRWTWNRYISSFTWASAQSVSSFRQTPAALTLHPQGCT